MRCQGCGIDDRVKVCELVNGSTIGLCPPCRHRHEELIAAVPIDGPEDLRAEEEMALGAWDGPTLLGHDYEPEVAYHSIGVTP